MTAEQLTSRQARAIQKAQALRLFERVDGDGHTFIVDSTTRTGQYHFVTRQGQSYRCDCLAGQQQQPCCHAAACYLVVNGLTGFTVTLRTSATVAGSEAPARPSDAQQREALRESIRRPLPADDDAGPSLASLLDSRPCQSAAA